MTNPAAPSPSFSSVPDEIVVNCLARISKSHYRSLSSVSKSFHSLLSSLEIYAARSQIGATEPRLYLCIGFPTAPHHRWFTLINPDQTIISNGEIKGELRLVPLKLSSPYSPVRLNAATVAVGSEIYQIGGSNKDKPSRIVCVLDCRSHTWRRAPDMMVARKHAKSWFLDGKIYVMGGCRKRDKSMNWGEIFDLKTQTWKPLPSPSDGFDPNHKVVVFGGKLYVITIHNKYGYDPKEGRWLQEVGFVGLERHITRPWCVIEKVIFTEFDGNYMWYNSRLREWLMVEGLGDLYMNRALYRTIQLANYGGKLVIILHERIQHVLTYGVRKPRLCDIRIWCAVIRLEERLSNFGSEIWGEIERLRVVHEVPESYKLLTCQSVSV